MYLLLKCVVSTFKMCDSKEKDIIMIDGLFIFPIFDLQFVLSFFCVLHACIFGFTQR